MAQEQPAVQPLPFEKRNQGGQTEEQAAQIWSRRCARRTLRFAY
jgi:hypothetical protein